MVLPRRRGEWWSHGFMGLHESIWIYGLPSLLSKAITSSLRSVGRSRCLRAGCCCGYEHGVKTPEAGLNEGRRWHSAKLVKENITVSRSGEKNGTYPISKKILRISSRTLRRGCRAPPFVGIPSASKLYFLKVDVFQVPLIHQEMIRLWNLTS